MYVDITGVTGFIKGSYSMGYGTPQASIDVECTGFSGSLNDVITMDLGYAGSHAVIFTGRVKEITEKRSRAGWNYNVRAYDELILAADFFIAADDPDSPYSIYNIASEDLVEDLLNLASITSYSSTAPGLTLATSGSYQIDRVYAIDMINKVATMAGYHVWTSANGTVNFKQLLPYPVGAPSHALTVGNTGELIELARGVSEESLRNRIVAYGAAGLKSVASAVSPHLPAGFYKTAIIGHPIMDTQAAVDKCSSENLTIMNRLSESVQCGLVGDHTILFGQTITVTEAKTGTSGDWFVSNISHSISGSGFITQLSLTK